jgi:hypothetical protein
MNCRHSACQTRQHRLSLSAVAVAGQGSGREAELGVLPKSGSSRENLQAILQGTPGKSPPKMSGGENRQTRHQHLRFSNSEYGSTLANVS